MKNYQTELENYIKSEVRKERLALHSCCGPCSSYVIEYLSQYFDVTVFFYNPNIYPESEYFLRLAEQKKICEIYNAGLVECDYDASGFEHKVKGLEDEPESGARCTVCFKMRLDNTAKLAGNAGFTLMTSTLTVSPHKNAPLINEIGEKAAALHGIGWLPCDFKKKGGYLRSVEICREYGIYRQDYCGCKFSLQNKKQV